MDDDWTDALRRAEGALRPAPQAVTEIEEEVRRRRRRRRTLAAAACGSALVVALAFAAVALPGDDQPPVANDPAPVPPDEAEELFSCADNPVFTSTVEPSPGMSDEWQQALEAAQDADFADFAVHTAQVTGLGVVALVTGDVDRARQVLVEEYGVTVVHPWQADVEDSGLDEQVQIEQVVQWTLDPVLREARRRTRGIEGSGGLSYWTSAGAILVQWKAPAPQEVLALEALDFASGGRIVVQEVRYSEREIQQAQDLVVDVAQSGGLGAEWTTASSCGDGSGLVVGFTPESLGDRRAELEQELARAAGMPVMVIAQDAPMPAGPGVG